MIKYRPDIDGLRAIAILTVVVYHAFPSLAHAGFIGVDVFFAISGYLITSIILKDLNQGSFSFKNFYVRRIIRLFPALLLMFIMVLGLGWFFFTTYEFTRLGKHVSGGAGFISNFIQLEDLDYFSEAAVFRPLMHLWSIAIEEQYYLLWPLALFLLGKKKSWVLPTALGLILISFILNLILVNETPSVAFLMPHTRMWQVLLGSLLAIIEERREIKLKHSSSIGLILLIASYVFIQPQHQYPGIWALFPTVSTLLIIAGGSEAWVNQKLLSQKWLVFIGLMSYPMYLLHWPLLSFCNILYRRDVPTTMTLLMLGLSVGLAVGTYLWVELPLRKLSPELKLKFSWPLFAALIIIIVVGLMAHKETFTSKHALITDKFSKAKADWDFPGRMSFRQSGSANVWEQGQGQKEILFLGDSHAEQLYPRAEKLLELTKDTKIKFITQGRCVPIRFVQSENQHTKICPQFIESALKEAESEKISTVVIAAHWDEYFKAKLSYFVNYKGEKLPIAGRGKGLGISMNELHLAIRKLTSSGKKVYLILSIPNGIDYEPLRMFSRSFSLTPFKFENRALPREQYLRENELIRDVLFQVASKAGAVVIDPIKELCGETECKTATQDGRPFYKDSFHMRANFARSFAKFVDPVFN